MFQNWPGAIAELKDFHDAFKTRRLKEAAKLENDPGTNSCAWTRIKSFDTDAVKDPQFVTKY